MTNDRIWLSLAHMGGKEQDFIQEAFDTNWVVPLGPNVDGFEKDLQEFLGKGVHVAALSEVDNTISSTLTIVMYHVLYHL